MKKLKMIPNQKLTFEEGYFTIGGFFCPHLKVFSPSLSEGVSLPIKKALLIDL